jgi:hypothetical protein
MDQIYLVNNCLKKKVFFLGFINIKYLDISRIIRTFVVGFQGRRHPHPVEASGY